jgi:hypothetical protein
VDRLVDDLLAAPTAAMGRHPRVADDEPDGIDGADRGDVVVGRGGGHGVV